jgi:FMN phosphatase YigB (HAD superfamily)
MIKALLIDLDDTLISNPDRPFARGFMATAVPYFSQALGIDASQTPGVLIHMIQQLAEKRWPNRSNAEVAVETLLPHTRCPRSFVAETLHSFYTHAFPALSSLVRPAKGAAEVLAAATNTGLKVVIATNPIYPREAIIARMHWAGLAVPADLAFITDADTMHFAKPDPAYYIEIVARLGIEPDEALMIGDNPLNDIEAARQAGLATAHLGSDLADLPEMAAMLGSRAWGKYDNAPPISPGMVIQEMRGNLGALRGLVNTSKPSAWSRQPDPDAWTTLQILTHLIDSERTAQRVRLASIMAEEQPFLVDPDNHGLGLRPLNDNAHELVKTFMHERRLTLDFLERTDAPVWQREARHSIFGLTTFLEMAHFTAQHDRIHINQLCATLGKCTDPD